MESERELVREPGKVSAGLGNLLLPLFLVHLKQLAEGGRRKVGRERQSTLFGDNANGRLPPLSTAACPVEDPFKNPNVISKPLFAKQVSGMAKKVTRRIHSLAKGSCLVCLDGTS